LDNSQTNKLNNQNDWRIKKRKQVEQFLQERYTLEETEENMIDELDIFPPGKCKHCDP
jgi:hypothetical protein